MNDELPLDDFATEDEANHNTEYIEEILPQETPLKPAATKTEEAPQKRGFFSRLFGVFKRLPIINRVAGDNIDETNFETYSKFKRFFESMELEDPLYPAVRQTSGLCDDALRIAKQRISLGTRLQEYDEKLLELEHFSRLSEEDINE